MTDAERVLERLSWQDDDIVAREWMYLPQGEDWVNMTRAEEGERPANAIKYEIGAGEFEVLRPFISRDGVMFRP